MNEAAAKSDRTVFAMMFNQRTNCVYRKMHEMVQGGELGASQARQLDHHRLVPHAVLL